MAAIRIFVLLFLTVTCTGTGTGNLQEKFSWKTLDFTFASDSDKQEAIENKTFIPENNIPTGIAVSDDKIFISIHRRLPGIPATLAYFDKGSKDQSPKLIAYPSLKDNEASSNCDNIIAVDRGMRFDNCNRLWVFDYGKVGKGENSKQICPPRIHIFDTKSNEKIRMYTLKSTDYNPSSIFNSASIDVGETCDDHYFYITDQQAIIVYSWKDNDSWRFEHIYCKVDPIATDYTFKGKNFQWNNAGVYATAVSPRLEDGSRTVYFHPLSSFREFSVSNKILHDKTKVQDNFHDFKQVGSRDELGRSTAEVSDKDDGVIFMGLLDKHAVACWKSGKPYTAGEQITIVAQDDEKLSFPSSLVIDMKNALWTLSIKYPSVSYSEQQDLVDSSEVNFRILRGEVDELKSGTPCDLA